MNFIEQFEHWLGESLRHDLPADVKGFAFNLFETSLDNGQKFGVELVGTEEFDPDDSDWACSEIWAPVSRRLGISSEFSGKDWEVCFDRMKSLIYSVVTSDSSVSRILKSKEGVAVGFVDGDLEIVWRR